MPISAPSTASWALPHVVRQPAMPLSTTSPERLLALRHVQLRPHRHRLDASAFLALEARKMRKHHCSLGFVQALDSFSQQRMSIPSSHTNSLPKGKFAAGYDLLPVCDPDIRARCYTTARSCASVHANTLSFHQNGTDSPCTARRCNLLTKLLIDRL